MLDPNPTDRQEGQNQNQLSISDGATHDKQYPFLKEFSELIAELSRKELENLLTHQQKMFAKAFWEAENYGGSTEKCKKRLKELHGPKWYEITSLEKEMTPLRDYQEWTLRIDHKRQWDKHWEKQKNIANIQSTKALE